MRFNSRFLRHSISAGLMMTAAGTSFGQTYTITDLGSNSWSYSEAHGMNGAGHVVGEFEATSSFAVLAFLYANGVMTELPHLGGSPYARPYGINDTNQVVGESDSGFNTHAFLYENGTISDLGTLGGNNSMGYSSAHAINRLGQIVGESTLSGNQASTVHAVLYAGALKTDLGALGGDYSSANAINNLGVIVGESDVVIQGVTNVHAFSYSDTRLTDLGTLGGGYSSAKGVNDAGVIVGEAETVSGGVTNLHAFVYRNGTMSDLGTFGGNASSASAINNAGQIVGYATDANEVSDAFLYDGTKLVNLNDLIPAGSGWTNLSSADAINDAGQIAGSGFLADGSYHAYLLTLATRLTVAITYPASNATFQAPASFVVSASTSDTAGTVTNVQFLADGSEIGNATSAPYSATANNLGAGAYTLTAVASDNAGLKATNSISVAVTDAPPTVAITNPAANATFQAPATFSINADASDPDGSVTNVQLLVNGSVIGNATAAPYSATASNLGAGAYTLTAVASDNAGLTATNSIQVTVVAPDVAPTVAITSPSAAATFEAPATFSVNADASDSDGTVTNVQFLVNGSDIGNATAEPYTATASNLDAGVYTLMAVASDNAGLKATNSISVTVTNSTLTGVMLSNLTYGGTGVSFSFPTQAGYNYQAEFTLSLSPTNAWLVFTNLTGNGSVVSVTDPSPTNSQRFYRVLAY